MHTSVRQVDACKFGGNAYIVGGEANRDIVSGGANVYDVAARRVHEVRLRLARTADHVKRVTV